MIENILKFAPVFNAFTNLVGGNVREVLVRRYIQPREGDSVLDIGCGPAEILAYLPEGRYVGIDPSARYIADANHRFGERGEFHRGVTGDVLFSPGEKFDLVLALGVLHHIDDAEALSLLRYAQSLLKPSGRFFSIDGCYVPSQSPLARWILKKDRGQYVRSESAYQALIETVFPYVKIEIDHRLLRIPYTHILMQGSAASMTS